MSLDLDTIEALAERAKGYTRARLTAISKADMTLALATPASVILEMIALIRRQEKELAEVREELAHAELVARAQSCDDLSQMVEIRKGMTLDDALAAMCGDPSDKERK